MLSIIIPCFNEQASLPYVYKELSSVCLGLDMDYELLFVDDGSKDETLKVIMEIAEKDSRVVYISFSRNFGKEAAMYAGFCNACGKYVAIMDADMQDPPSLLPEMLNILKEGRDGINFDSVATRRINRKGEPPIRSFFAKQFYKIINKISDSDIVDGARDFRLMDRKMVDAIVSMGEYNRFSKGIFGWVGFSTYWLPYENVERVAGETKWSFWKLCKYAIDGIINFSDLPLSIASWGGVLMTAVSFIFLMYVFVKRIVYGNPVAGWASLVSVMIFL
ncbi:MAG: glycosyltransferase family 2 protein, partial [Clostridia bacterium]|nr:glycosyltransferase family 2 protein [Clostridia bacterium]